ncbi:hypothetical protein Cgig2_021761 [Carnegiea gigantea]|uniref:Uncharacterized protein n=1 Tax=Carnegiea gigantea TaxID=171969 RepID=A0A9Q1GKL5_9CARY|nr:hypothetical protein Cgig2_021761 [Carnegiea gigantea]
MRDCEFHAQNGHSTAECRELRKALHELADKGQIDRFLKRGMRFLRKEYKHVRPKPRDKECSTELVATIAGGYVEGITRSIWKAQLRGAQQVLTAEQGRQDVNPTGVIRLPLCFGDKVREKNLEVDFLVVDITMAYNIILGRPTLHKVKSKRKTKRSKTLGALDVGVFIIITALGHPGNVTFIARRGLLIIHSDRGVKLHQLRVLTFGSGLTAILKKLDIRLEIAFSTEGLRHMGLKELPKNAALSPRPH